MIIIAISVASRSTVGWTPFLFSFVAAGALFTVLLVFAIRGWLGGGDVKLAAALATGLPPVATWNFVIITVLAGGLLGFGYLVGPRFTPRLRVAGTSHIFARVLAIEVWRLRRGGPLPYGVAIAAGGVFVLLSTPR